MGRMTLHERVQKALDDHMAKMNSESKALARKAAENVMGGLTRKEGGPNDSDMGQDPTVSAGQGTGDGIDGLSPAAVAAIFQAGIQAGLARQNAPRGQRAMDLAGVHYAGDVDLPGNPNATVLGDRAAAAHFRSASAHRARMSGLSRALGVEVQGPGGSGRATVVEKSEGNSKLSTDPLPRSSKPGLQVRCSDRCA